MFVFVCVRLIKAIFQNTYCKAADSPDIGSSLQLSASINQLFIYFCILL